jgi:alanyl-tRNA synthetase
MMKIDEFVQKSLVEIRTLRKSNKDLSFRLLEAFSQTPGTNIKNTNVKVIEFPSDRKILTSAFKNFSPNTLLVAKLNSLSIIILSSSPDADANKLMKFFNEKFGGKGGGGPKVAQGSLKKEPEDLILVIKEFLT